MLRHARDAALRYLQEKPLQASSFVVEVASNDGYLLKNFAAVGIPCIGIEPAENVACVARRAGVETRCEFFGKHSASALKDERGAADLILGNNVFAHAPDINDFVSGELENIVLEAWKNEKPDIMIIEGQGSMLNPAYPGGFEIVAATRPDAIIMQHAPMRKEYDGFPGYKMHDLKTQIQVAELISGKKVIAITVNHENLKVSEIDPACKKIQHETGLPTVDILFHGTDVIRNLLKEEIEKTKTIA